MKKFLLCGIALIVIFIGGCSSSEEKAICQKLVELKNEILADYAGYHTATMMSISSLSGENKKLIIDQSIIDLTNKAVELTEKYINLLYLSENDTGSFSSKYSRIGPKPKNSGNKGMDAPDFCSNEESYVIKNLDDIYIKFYWCFVNSEMSEDYGVNLISCSTNLTESFYGHVVDVYNLYNGE